MKKCNFFRMLFLALFVLYANFSFSQEVITPEKASYLVQAAVQTLKSTRSPNAVKQNTHSTESSAVLIQRLKIIVGQTMIDPLAKGANVSATLSSALAPYANTGMPGMIKARNEVEIFYKNLLKI